ncbi:MAG: sigma 54-interacting transcriptional regulator [Desulfuromonadales bacterium]|nr:sigma 54-interacting transcriptional regulator [Desulfuromonadales bacterium]
MAFIYLENNRSRDAFSSDRLTAIQVISAQAAIALENARLLAGLKQEIATRRQAEDNLQRALDEVALLKDKLQAENLYLREEVLDHQGFDEIVGKSEELRRVLAKVSQVAATDATVLILGETGTGKELIARAIHSRSTRNTGAMVKVNCATLPANLIESELFGHDKGAFTGAHSKKIGRFELADGGTIFLDEIGELPFELQSKLLRVLQEGEFERVGSSFTQKVNVRVITATNRDLKTAVEEGKFRSDLYFRLSVFPVELPPLRHRKEDIPLLAWYFITKKQAKFGKSIKGIPNEVMAALVHYPWPGNIRELENVLERATILAQGHTLALDEAFALPAGGEEAQPVQKRLEEVERQHIEQVLEQCGWRVKGKGNAADRLGLNPSTLSFRMKKLGILRPAGR